MLLHVGYIMDPNEVKVPKPPDDWVDPDPNTEKGGPNFDKVDNPGVWSSLSYRPVFASGAQGSKYKFYCIPVGCQPVPPNEDNTKIITHEGWNVLYQGRKKGGYEDSLREKIYEEDPPPWVDVK